MITISRDHGSETVSTTGERREVTKAVRLFRAPHHTISDVGLIGGGQVPLPGEVSLAHHGILLFDELPELKRHVLEVFNHSRRVLQANNFAGVLDLTALAALAKLAERKTSLIS
jgi:hypothetical protein